MSKIWVILIFVIGFCPAVSAQQDSLAVIPIDSSTVDVVTPKKKKDKIAVEELEQLNPTSTRPKEL